MMADAAADHVVQFLDTEILYELARNRLAFGVLDSGREHSVIEDDRDFAAIRNSFRHRRGRGEGEIDLNDHVHVADHNIARMHRTASAVPREDLLRHRHSHDGTPNAPIGYNEECN